MSDFTDGFLEWHSEVPLLSGVTQIIAPGNQNSGATFVCTRCSVNFNFGIISQLTCNLLLDVSLDPAFAVFVTWITFPVPANTYQTVYDLAPPLNANGFIILNDIYMRIRIADTATANHAFTHFYAKAWR